MSTRISGLRLSTDNETVLVNLGLLRELAGTWKGSGFNLIARPDFHDQTDLYLQLNQTTETLQFTPIGSAIPNRGFGQDDIQLYGLTYLQQISDAGNDGALHIEPGIWITQPQTTFPPDTVPLAQQLVARMGSIPHGNAMLAAGVAAPFAGPPVLTIPGSQYSFSLFPSFNSTPFGAPPTAPGIVINAAGSSEKLTAPNLPPPTPLPFPQYDLTVPIGPIPSGPINPPFALNTRTPYDTSPPEPTLPAAIDGVDMQTVINDPIAILQAEIQQLVAAGYTFEGVALNIATVSPLTFLTTPNSGPPPKGATTSVTVPQFGGGIENIQFLTGALETVAGASEPVENAQTAVVYATFWIEKASNKATGDSFMQLQYAQFVVLDFPVFHLLNPAPPTAPSYVNLGWPHISVATLRKTFN